MAKRTRKTEEATETQQVQEVQVIEKTKWRVKSGGITLLDRRYFGKGDIFEAFPDEIPSAFRDLLENITPIKEKPVKAAPVYSMREIVPTAEEQDEEDFVQLYELINTSDKVISEKPLTKEEAEEQLNSLNK